MSKQFVWCKQKKQLWWVGERIEDPPEDVIEAQKKHTKAIVYFHTEKSYHYVVDLATLVPYETDKEDHVRKGLQWLISTKSSTLELFKADVLNAEEALGGDTGIIERLLKEEMPSKTPKKSIVAQIFKPIPVTPAKPQLPPTPSPRLTKKTATPSRKSKGPTPQVLDGSQKYTCDRCGFSSGRPNVILAHRKTHTGVSTPIPNTATVGKASPMRKNSPKIPRGNKTTPITSTPTTISSPGGSATPKRGRGRPPASSKILSPEPPATPTEKIPRSPKKKKASPKKEIAKEEILADWNDDDDDVNKPSEESLSPPIKNKDYNLLFESLLQKKSETGEVDDKMDMDVGTETSIKNETIETEKEVVLVPQSDAEIHDMNVVTEAATTNEVEKVEVVKQEEDLDARFNELMEETTLEIPTFDLKKKLSPKIADDTSTEEEPVLKPENPHPSLTKSAKHETDTLLPESVADVEGNKDSKDHDETQKIETPTKAQKSNSNRINTPETPRTSSRTRSKITPSPVVAPDSTPTSRSTRRSSLRSVDKNEEQKQLKDKPVRKGQKSMRPIKKELQSPIVEEPSQPLERTIVAVVEEEKLVAPTQVKPESNAEDNTSNLTASNVAPTVEQPTVYAKKSLPQYVEEKPMAVTRSGRRTSSTFARIPAVSGTSKASVLTAVTQGSGTPAESIVSKQNQSTENKELTDVKTNEEIPSGNVESTDSPKTHVKAVVAAKKSTISPVKSIPTTSVVKVVTPTLPNQVDMNGGNRKNTAVRTPIAAIADSIVKTPSKGQKRKQILCSTPDTPMKPELEGPPSKQRNQNQISAEQNTSSHEIKPILESSSLTSGKPVAAIKPTMNDDDSIIRQALQGTMKSSPAEKKETQAVEAPLEQVVHLVPVENADGSVTYMILSLDDNEDLKIDSVVASGSTSGELDPELDAVYLDKSVDCQTLLESIHVPTRQQQQSSSTVGIQSQVQFIQSPAKQLAITQQIVPSSSNALQEIMQSPSSSSVTAVQPILIQQQDGTEEIVNIDASALVGANQEGFLQSDGSILLVMGDGAESIDPSSCGVDLQQFYNTQ